MKKIPNRFFILAAGAFSALASSAAFAGTLGVFTSNSNGFDTHPFYYEDGKEVTLIDTQFVPSLTEAMVKEVKSKTASPQSFPPTNCPTWSAIASTGWSGRC
jgi:hypothetical protein